MAVHPKPILIIITGPTASGKSELAVQLAKKFRGEIISADSRQLYRFLTIGTAKVSGRWKDGLFTYRGIPHFLIDEINPRQRFTVAEYQARAAALIRAIHSRHHIPLLVGGSGFYIRAVVYALHLPPVPPNPTLRRRLAHKTPDELFQILRGLDKKRSATIEKQNPRRLIRAIEIATALDHVPPMRQDQPYRTLWIGLGLPTSVLTRRIKKRVQRMLARGLLREVERLLQRRVSKKRIREFGFEYSACLDYLDGRLNPQELGTALVRQTLTYVRRQMAWLKNKKHIHWIRQGRHAELLVRRFLAQSR